MLKYPVILVMAATRWHFNKFRNEYKKTADGHECSRMVYIATANICRGVGGASLIYLESSVANKAYYEEDFIPLVRYAFDDKTKKFFNEVVVPKLHQASPFIKGY